MTAAMKGAAIRVTFVTRSPMAGMARPVSVETIKIMLKLGIPEGWR